MGNLHSADRLLNAADLQEIRSLEESLWQAESRFDKELMDRIFAPDFFEFGRSGRRYARAEMFFEKAAQRDIAATLPLPEFHARHLSDDIVQVTYVSEVRYGRDLVRGNRSSVWSRTEVGWRLRFHQGTPLRGEPDQQGDGL